MTDTHRIPLSELRWWVRYSEEQYPDATRRQLIKLAVASARSERIDSVNPREVLV